MNFSTVREVDMQNGTGCFTRQVFNPSFNMSLTHNFNYSLYAVL